MCAARIVWGTPSDEPRMIDADALERAEESSFTFLETGEIGDAAAGPGTESEGGPIPAERLVYLVEDAGSARPIAVAGEGHAGNGDVLAAVEEEWRARTRRTDVRPDAPAEPPTIDQTGAKPASS